MAKTHWVDKETEEILSPTISGLQHAARKIEESLDMDTDIATNEPLTLLADGDGVFRIAESVNKRNWLNDPAPVIKKNGVVITEGFTIDYAGGAVIFSTQQTGNFTASFTYVKNTSGFNSHLLKEASQTKIS